MNLTDTLKGIAKIVLLSRPTPLPEPPEKKRIFVLGNGPSLSEAIRDFGRELAKECCMAVNFAANAPEFHSLRPDYYILVDPHFFRPRGEDATVDHLWENLRSCSWKITLFVPVKSLKAARARLSENGNITVLGINAVGVEGWKAFRHCAYSARLAMPRPRNVLIPAIMTSIWIGFKEIIILGADHSWMKTLSVSDDNEVVSIQPHFYKEEEREEKRVRHEYRGYRLHQIVESFAIAFKAYHNIANFALSRGITIVNATPGSFIDAFPRQSLKEYF